MFQNLPTKVNVLMATRYPFSYNPYLTLKVTKVYTCNASAYKRRELMTKEDTKN